jgi:hypothetical protein
MDVGQLLSAALVGSEKASPSRFSAGPTTGTLDWTAAGGQQSWTSSPEFASLVRANVGMIIKSTASTDAPGDLADGAPVDCEAEAVSVSRHTQTYIVTEKNSATQTKVTSCKKRTEDLLADLRRINEALDKKVAQLRRNLQDRDEEIAHLRRERKRYEAAKLTAKDDNIERIAQKMMFVIANKKTHRTQKASRMAKQLFKLQ